MDIAKKQGKRTMKRLWICMGILVCAIVIAVVATDASEEGEHHAKAPEHLDRLDRNVRLDFQSVPLEEGDEGMYIVTASPEYETSVRVEGPDGRIAFKVGGQVRLLDDGGIFLRYETHAHLAGKGQEVEGHVRSSVILKGGQELPVSRVGDKTLMIRASYVDSKTVAE